MASETHNLKQKLRKLQHWTWEKVHEQQLSTIEDETSATVAATQPLARETQECTATTEEIAAAAGHLAIPFQSWLFQERKEALRCQGLEAAAEACMQRSRMQEEQELVIAGVREAQVQQHSQAEYMKKPLLLLREQASEEERYAELHAATEAEDLGANFHA